MNKPLWTIDDALRAGEITKQESTWLRQLDPSRSDWLLLVLFQEGRDAFKEALAVEP